MSIYAVKLCEFYPPSCDMFDTAYFLVKSDRCHACGHKLRWKSAIAAHCYTYTGTAAFCSWECLKSNKTAKVDKRRERRMNRKLAKMGLL